MFASFLFLIAVVSTFPLKTNFPKNIELINTQMTWLPIVIYVPALALNQGSYKIIEP